MRRMMAVIAVALVFSLPGSALPQESVACHHACSHCCCHNDFWTRDTLTGDWLGYGPALAKNGIVIDSSLTQFYQGVASGGNQQVFKYGGKFDLFMHLDTEKMGLWQGGKLAIHGVDWQYGQNVVAGLASLAPVNANAVTPTVEESFALTTLLYEHELGGGFLAAAGRINTLDFWEILYPDYGRGVDGFMNMSINLPMNCAPSMPFIGNVAGLLKGGKRGIEAGFLVMESNHVPTTVGMDFPNETTLVAIARKYTDFCCLPGSHTLMAAYAGGDYTSFDTSGWVVLPGGGVIPTAVDDSWMAVYLAEQRFWVDPCNERRYAKLFGKLGYSDSNTSPFGCTASLSAEAFGAMDCRPNDRMGIGYFYNGLNADFKGLFAGTNPLQDVHGGEIYYNAAVTPWFHLTADMQVVNVAAQSNDPAIVVALRGKIDF
jgi:porin